MARTSNHGLFNLDLDAPNWHHLYNHNIDAMERRVLFLTALSDVEVTALQDGSILQYNGTSGKWEVVAIRR